MNFTVSPYIFKILLIFFIQWSLAMKKEETEAIQKLRPLVKNTLTQKYMEEDAFLLRFLQAASLDVDRASQLIKTSMIWRVENEIDGIENEENPMDHELPHTIGVDRNGRPAIFIRVGETDVRKSMITGKRHLTFRSGLKLVEKMASRARALNATQVIAIIDLNGFSYRRHACRDCLKFGQDIGEVIETNYPGMAAGIFFINTPRIFEVALSIVKGILSVSSRNVLHVYGFDKVEWTDALLQWVSPTELSALLGTDVISNQNMIRHSQHYWKADERDVVVSMSNDLQKLHYANSSPKMILFRPTLPFSLFFCIILFYLTI